MGAFSKGQSDSSSNSSKADISFWGSLRKLVRVSVYEKTSGPFLIALEYLHSKLMPCGVAVSPWETLCASEPSYYAPQLCSAFALVSPK